MKEYIPSYRRPKIVVIGGGTGLPVILKELKDKNADVTAIVTVADDGGSSGELRKAFNVVPPGDIRNILVALSDMPALHKSMFQYRFKSEDKTFDGHSLGNLILLAASEMQGGSMYQAIQLMAKMMHVDAHVYPASDEPLILHARYTDGTVGSGESKIARADKVIDYVAVSTVSDSPDHTPVRAGKKVVSSIMEADMIVLGPGSLYTSILPTLMIPEVGQAILETSAKILYICNIMTQFGETEGFTDADHVRVLHKHLSQKFVDILLANIGEVPDEYIFRNENEEYLYPVEHDFEACREEVETVISDNFLNLTDKGVYHNGEKVVSEIFHLLSSHQ